NKMIEYYIRIPTAARTAKDCNNFHKNTSVICEAKPLIDKDRLKPLISRTTNYLTQPLAATKFEIRNKFK
ncbi:MAG: hypothetical protein NUV76_04145, partial [Candidatus Kuenenia sp.]|nr:hypothetical protein [Candidatus Kuenenia sp.]